VPELGAIPSSRASSHNRYYYARQKETPAEASRKPNTLLTADSNGKGGHRETVELVTLQRRPSMTAEAFRTVLTSILFSGENGSRPRVLAITSPGPGEGKTTVATNLAIALAEIGRRVLLIDADLRRPRIHTIFRLENEVGLTTILSEVGQAPGPPIEEPDQSKVGQAPGLRTEEPDQSKVGQAPGLRTEEPDQSKVGQALGLRTEEPDQSKVGQALGLRRAPSPPIDRAIVQTAVPNLFAIPSGPHTSAAASLLFSPHLQELLQRFRGEFDTVLIDTPPTLQMPDARVIGRLSDAVVLVTRANHTTRDAALAARERFGEDKTRVLGTILNDWDPRLAPNGYYGYYKGYYQGGGYKGYYSKSSS
jgi:Mrp family chromosome partitioning ATPase